MDERMRIAVILPAAGRSRRFGSAAGADGKLAADLAGRAVLIRAVELFTGRPEVGRVVVAGPPEPDRLDAFKLRWADRLGLLGATIVPGGSRERWETVAHALKAVEADATHVAVHDAARPITPATVLDRVFAAARRHPAVVPGVPVHATLKRVENRPIPSDAPGSIGGDPSDAILGPASEEEAETHRIIETVPRTGLWMAQTPQLFRRDRLERAYRRIAEGRAATEGITDDAGLVEAMGDPVVAVHGDPLNVKITAPEDLPLAEAALRARIGAPPADAPGPKRRHPARTEEEEQDVP